VAVQGTGPGREKLTARRRMPYSTCVEARPRRLLALLAALVALAPSFARATEGASADEQRSGRTTAERRRVEQLDLGRPSTVHRLIRNRPTARQLRTAGGDERPATLLYPIPGARIGRGDGSGTDAYHKALDIIADEGTAILAAESGLVVYTGDELRGFGNLVVLLHPGGWLTYYAHLSAFLVRPGQKVERGQRIARVGNTGISHGPHLHFVLWMEGEQIDPYPFFRPAPGVPRSGPLPHVGHRVRGGDTWASVADRYGLTVEELRTANHLPAGTDLRTGWQLLVPRRMDSAPIGDEPDPGSPEDGTYTVRAGDTLSEVAERFSIPLADLARWNDLADPSRIRADMVLVLNGEDVPEEEADDDEATDEAAAVMEEPAAPSATEDAAEAPVAVAEEDAPAPTAPGDVHVVREGETLSEIAETLGLHTADLVLANPGLQPDRLQPGRELRVPDVGGGPADEAVPADGGRDEEFTTVIVVREGDSLWSIARRHDTSVRKLRSLNPELGAEERLRPGQELRVPQREQ
jgi:murein DD-endopeptidase MepM/ murein hydrolase activator NlpD